MAVNITGCLGQMFRVTFMESEYFKISRSTKNQEQKDISFEGVEWKLLNTLFDVVKSKYDLHQTPFGHYGALLPNNSWTGAVGRLHDNLSDIALAGLSDTFERRSAIDFSTPYIIDTVNFFVGVEPPYKYKYKVAFILSPFESVVWLVFFALMILVLIILYILNQNNQFSNAKPFLQVLRIALKQDVDERKIPANARSIVLLWITCCTFLILNYCNELTASTGTPIRKHDESLATLSTLFRKGKMSFFIYKHSSNVHVIKSMPPLPYGDLFRQVVQIIPECPMNWEDLESRRKTTLISRLRTTVKLQRKGFTERKIKAVEEPLTSIRTAVGFRKGFPCQSTFNWVVVSMRESGCLHWWLQELMWPVTMQRMKDDVSHQNLFIGFRDLEATFLLLLMGSFFGLFMCVLEYVCDTTKCLRKLVRQSLSFF